MSIRKDQADVVCDLIERKLNQEPVSPGCSSAFLAESAM